MVRKLSSPELLEWLWRLDSYSNYTTGKPSVLKARENLRIIVENAKAKAHSRTKE